MTAHEWKVLASFGLLVGAISIFDPPTAKVVVTIAIVVIVVRNADKIPFVGETSQPKATRQTANAQPLYV